MHNIFARVAYRISKATKPAAVFFFIFSMLVCKI